MATIISILLIAELSFFILFDLLKFGGHAPAHRKIRLVAGATGILLVLLELLLPLPCEPDHLVVDMMIATEILMVFPCSFEKPSLAVKAALAINAFGVLSFLAFAFMPSGHWVFRAQRTVWSYLLILSSFVLYFGVVAVRRFNGIRLFFRNWAVWHTVEDYTRFLYALAFLGLGIYSLCSVSVPGNAGLVMTVGADFMFMGLYAVLYLRALTGRTYVLAVETEDRIKDIIKGNLRTSFIDKAEEDRKMNNLYRKVMFYMAEKKPYLDPDFCMNDLSERMFSNKLYLSKTIKMVCYILIISDISITNYYPMS